MQELCAADIETVTDLKCQRIQNQEQNSRVDAAVGKECSNENESDIGNHIFAGRNLYQEVNTFVDKLCSQECFADNRHTDQDNNVDIAEQRNGFLRLYTSGRKIEHQSNGGSHTHRNNLGCEQIQCDTEDYQT